MQKIVLKDHKKLIIFLLLIALAIFVSYPIFNNYLVYGHDLKFHLNRIEGIKDALQNLQIPVRIHSSLNNGYGYITPVVYPELFLYIPAILMMLGVSLVSSYKFLILLINLISVFSMFYCMKKISKKNVTGIIGALIYAGATYRIQSIFTRSALGESLAMAFMPLAILGLYEVLNGNRKKWITLVIGVTGVLQSHLISTVFLIIISILFAAAYAKNIIKEKRFKEIIISIVAVLLLNLWFIVPFASTYYNNEYPLWVRTYNDSNFYVENVVYPAQLFNVFDDGNSERTVTTRAEGMEYDMALSLGFVCSLGLIISIVYCFMKKSKEDKNIKLIRLLTITSIICIILSTSILPWDKILSVPSVIQNFCNMIRLPWRFFEIATLFISISFSLILGEIVSKRFDKNKRFDQNYVLVIHLAVAIFILTILFLGPYSKQEVYLYDGDTVDNDMSLNGEYFLNGTDTSKLTTNRYNSSQGIKITKYEKNGSTIHVFL